MTRVARQTFRPRQRIRKRREYKLVYEGGLRVGGEHLVLFVQANGLGHARLGMTATRRVGTAVTRNAVRRRVREAFRRSQDRLGPWDIVVNIRSSAAGRPAREIEQEFVTLCGRAARLLARQAPRQ